MPFAAMTAQAKSAAQSSALSQPSPPMSAIEMPMKAAMEVKRVGAMMPGVGLHRGAFDVSPEAVDVAKEKLLYHDHDEQTDERERRRRVMRRENFAHALNRETDRGGETRRTPQRRRRSVRLCRDRRDASHPADGRRISTRPK